MQGQGGSLGNAYQKETETHFVHFWEADRWRNKHDKTVKFYLIY